MRLFSPGAKAGDVAWAMSAYGGCAMPEGVIFIHDPDPGMLHKHSVPLLREYRVEEGGLDLRAFENRNELLAAIAAEQRPSLALVDLQHDDWRDLNYSGHRIIETIRYHPSLWQTCRPLAFTVHAVPQVLALVARHGAYGMIAQSKLDAALDVDLCGQLREQLRRPAVGPG